MTSLTIVPDACLKQRSVQDREPLIRTYAYLCSRGARKFLRAGLERNDLEQVANIGLLKAADRYDPTLKTPFEAYAWLFIVGELMHHVRDHERLVRPPRKLRTLERRFQSACDRLTIELGRVPSDHELASHLNTDVQTVVQLQQCRLRATADSIETLSSHQSERYVCGDSIDSVLDRILIQTALASLTRTERQVITGLYELGLSQIEVAEKLGYSQRHVSRLHKAALQKMLPVWVQ